MVRLALLLLIGSVGAAAQENAEHGEDVFKKCKVCHDVGEGAKIKVGPPLNNIVGRKAGSLEAYPYSSDLKALAAQGFVCDEKNLDQYLEKLQDGRQQRENGVPRIEG